MRLWHESLIPKLPRQQLLGQHRECCALRGGGWGKKHATVNYVFDHSPYKLFQYLSFIHFICCIIFKESTQNLVFFFKQVQLRGKLVTVFSSSNYNDGNNEAACVLAYLGKLRLFTINTNV